MSAKSAALAARPVWVGGLVVATIVPIALLAGANRPDTRASTAPPDLPTASCSNESLPTLGGLFGEAVAANLRGVIVGTATDAAGESQAVLWRAGRVQRLSTGTTGAVAVGVNGRGDVVGIGRSGATSVGWVWSGGATVRLRTSEGDAAAPAAINDGGLVVGALSENEGSEGEVPGQDENEHAAFWQSPTSGPTVLSPLAGDQGGQALAVDNRGRIGGFSSGTGSRPVIWDAGRRPRALADLGGGFAAVRALADSGLAAGDAVSADGIDHPVIWDHTGRITQLGLPAGARAGTALAVLPDATVIGTVDVPLAGGGVQKRAVRWSASGTPAALSATDGRTGSAAGNAADGSSYAGYATDPVGGRHPVLWRCGR